MGRPSHACLTAARGLPVSAAKVWSQTEVLQVRAQVQQRTLTMHRLPTRFAAQHRERIATANFRQKLALVEAERKAAEEREQAAELRLENEVRTQYGARWGRRGTVGTGDLIRNESKWSTAIPVAGYLARM
jgi:hypothetical protein